MKLKENSNWYTRIHVKWCDFVLYFEGGVKIGKHKIYSERIIFDPLLWNSLLKNQRYFLRILYNQNCKECNYCVLLCKY